MNTFGKILVVLNLLAGLAVLAFFMAVGPRQANWKAYAESLKEQLDVSKANSLAKDPEVGTLNIEVRNKENDRKTLAKDREKDKKEFDEKLQEANAKITERDLKVTEAALNVQRAQEENARMRIENDALSKSLQRSEQDKLVLQDTANKYRKESADFRNERDQTQERNRNLAEVIRQKDKVIQELASRGTGPGTTVAFNTSNVVRDPNAPNPPPVKVQGKVMKVSRDATDTLVSLSVGTDHGVTKNHTLVVYRTFPTPQYLGMLRIIDTTERESIGRLMGRGATNSPLRVDDIVVDNLSSP